MPRSDGNPRDNEGVLYVANGARSWPMAPRPWFNPDAAAMLVCPRCGNNAFGVIVSNRPFIQIFCPDCQFAWGPMEMHKPQMTNSVALDLGMGLALPSEFNTIEAEMDLRPGVDIPDDES